MQTEVRLVRIRTYATSKQYKCEPSEARQYILSEPALGVNFLPSPLMNRLAGQVQQVRHTMKRRGGHSGGPENELVRVSKAMSKVLRHSPPPGAMDAQGWVALPVLLQHLRGDVTEELVRRVVDENDKARRQCGAARSSAPRSARPNRTGCSALLRTLSVAFCGYSARVAAEAICAGRQHAATADTSRARAFRAA